MTIMSEILSQEEIEDLKRKVELFDKLVLKRDEGLIKDPMVLICIESNHNAKRLLATIEYLQKQILDMQHCINGLG